MYTIAPSQHLSLMCQVKQPQLCMDTTCACRESTKETKYLLTGPTISHCLINLARELREARMNRSEPMEAYQYTIYVALLHYLDQARDEMFKQGCSLGEVDVERLTRVMGEMVSLEQWNYAAALKVLSEGMGREFLEIAIPQHG